MRKVYCDSCGKETASYSHLHVDWSVEVMGELKQLADLTMCSDLCETCMAKGLRAFVHVAGIDKAASVKMDG